MASVTFNIDQALNNSLKIGDTLFFCEHANSNFGIGGNYDTATEGPIKVGNITSVNGSDITIDYAGLSVYDLPGGVDYNTMGYQNPGNYFMFFSKNNIVELNRLKGYYASVNFINNSRKKAELFNVGAEIVRSSK